MNAPGSKAGRIRNKAGSRSSKEPEPAPNRVAAAWVPLGIGIVLVWPWLASMVCGITGVCLSPGDHRKDGWISIHKIESSSWRLAFGVMAIGTGIATMGPARRA